MKQSPYYHAFAPKVGWWLVIGVVCTLTIAVIACLRVVRKSYISEEHNGAKLYRVTNKRMAAGTRQLLKRVLLTLRISLGTLVTFMFAVESFTGLVQLASNFTGRSYDGAKPMAVIMVGGAFALTQLGFLIVQTAAPFAYALAVYVMNGPIIALRTIYRFIMDLGKDSEQEEDADAVEPPRFVMMIGPKEDNNPRRNGTTDTPDAFAEGKNSGKIVSITSHRNHRAM